MNEEFTGIWIDKEVWNDTRLSIVEKALLSEVRSFASRSQKFFKTNEAIAQHFQVSIRSVTRAVMHLEKLELVQREPFDGRKRVLTCQNVNAASSKSRSSMDKKSKQRRQNDTAAASKRRTERNKERNTERTLKKKAREVQFPFDDFEEVWTEWKEYKRDEHNFRFKSERSEQTALKQLQTLAQNDRTNAVQIVGQSIANGWKGFFPLRNNSATATATTRSGVDASDAEQFAQFIKTGRVSNDA